MANLEKDHSYSGNPQQPGVTPEEYAVPDVGISCRLRDRELLRKRKAEAEEKDTQQEQKKHKRARKGRATRKGSGQRQARQPEAEEAEIHEAQVTAVEEKAEVTHGLPEERSAPLVVTEGLYSQQEATPSVFSYAHQPGVQEIPRPEGSDDPQSLENDHLEPGLFELL